MRDLYCKDCRKAFHKAQLSKCRNELTGVLEYQCPYCGSTAFMKTIYCDNCGEMIEDHYYKTPNGNKYCEECCVDCDIDDEENFYEGEEFEEWEW